MTTMSHAYKTMSKYYLWVSPQLSIGELQHLRKQIHKCDTIRFSRMAQMHYRVPLEEIIFTSAVGVRTPACSRLYSFCVCLMS